MNQAKSLIYLLLFTLVIGSGNAWAANHSPKRARAVASQKGEHPALNSQTELGDQDYDPANPPGQLRVLVALGPSTFFFQNGRPHGVEYAMLLELEKFLNRNRAKTATPLKLMFVPVESGELIPSLRAGKGDIAAGLMPVNEGSKQLVAFTQPYLRDQWCVVQNPNSPAMSDIKDADGKTLTLASGSYARRLLLDYPRVITRDAAAGTTAEAVLGSIQTDESVATLSSRYVADLWGKKYPRLRNDACIEPAVDVAWAVDQSKPQLLAELNRFISSSGSGMAQRALKLTQRFLSSDAKISNPNQLSAVDKLGFFAPMFQLVASANNMDWMLLAAIGQRESTLHPVIRKNGPTGIMQINPSTARKMGVTNPHDNEQNVTAAARYLAYLRDMFKSPEIEPDDQLAFMIAAYNAGEGRIQQLRKKAQAQGLDPNRWSGNVEKVARQTVGGKLLDYVSTVNRYYLAYQGASHAASVPQAEEASAVADKN
ncbi:transglycosylase SLT domain-containing protein [Silvimonas iriomotensis]|uniref:Lytic transglycosylase F n=1 Tax=Silvimonas iriomotensis TaxID=449662 RepID=A0ABQ2P5B9_9NEIS|nr:transporter substrate-binding domain-containing protein [Silvimonas iriomotensis]GGP18710.1 lytic transglycosylase F [Silvimonas iriomotensis]